MGTVAGEIFIFSVLHNISQKIPWMGFLDRMSGHDLQSLHQGFVLFRCDLQYLFLCTRPVEVSKFHSFIQEKKPVTFLSEHSDKNRYPQTFLIRTFSFFHRRYRNFLKKCADKINYLKPQMRAISSSSSGHS